MAPPGIRRLLGERIADQAGESAGEALVIAGGGFDGDPVLARHVAAAVAKQTRRGTRIAHAGGRHASNRIDAVIALAMAADRAENQPKPAKLVGSL